MGSIVSWFQVRVEEAKVKLNIFTVVASHAHNALILFSLAPVGIALPLFLSLVLLSSPKQWHSAKSTTQFRSNYAWPDIANWPVECRQIRDGDLFEGVAPGCPEQAPVRRSYLCGRQTTCFDSCVYSYRCCLITSLYHHRK